MTPTLAALTRSTPGMTLDLTSGPVAQYLGTTLGLAWGLFAFCFILGLGVEAFGRSPAMPRDFGGIVLRAAVVLMLLTFYGRIFGSLIGLAEGIAARVAPQDVWARFTEAQSHWMNVVEQQAAHSNSILGNAPGMLQGYFFDSLVAICLLLGQASLWVVNTFGRVLAALLYILGPLALVFSIPRTVGSGGRWLSVFVSVLCWPALSGLLVSLTVSFGLQGIGGAQADGQGAGVAFESLALAGLMGVIAFAVPLLASALVGSSFGVISSGFSSMVAFGAPASMVLSRALGMVPAGGLGAEQGGNGGGGKNGGGGNGGGAGGAGAGRPGGQRAAGPAPAGVGAAARGAPPVVAPRAARASDALKRLPLRRPGLRPLHASVPRPPPPPPVASRPVAPEPGPHLPAARREPLAAVPPPPPLEALREVESVEIDGLLAALGPRVEAEKPTVRVVVPKVARPSPTPRQANNLTPRNRLH